MKNLNYIPQMRPSFGLLEKLELSNYLDSGGYFTEFNKTKDFEAEIAGYTGAKHAIVVNNGTISLTIAALVLGVGPGDEVIVPNYTMIATPNAIKLIGATPVFVDVDPKTLVMDFEGMKKAVTKKTKAILLVLANGRAPAGGVAEFIEFGRKFNLPIIEDAAQALGSYYDEGVHIGLAGDIGSLSFSAPKIISTGQGGALITNNDDLANKIRRIKDFGRASGGNDIHETIGFNFKFTDLQACVGIAQMSQLKDRVIRKKQIWNLYESQLKDVSGIELFAHNINLCTPWFIDAMVDHRDKLVVYLHENGIGSRTMYPPINKQVAYSVPGEYPNSNLVGANGLWLPSFIDLSNSEISHVCSVIKKFYG